MGTTLREAIAGSRRFPLLSLLTVLTIGLALYSVGIFALLHRNLSVALGRVGERVGVIAYLREGTSGHQAAEALREVGRLPGVLSVDHVTKEEALERFRREFSGESDLLEGLETNPLPVSIEVSLDEGHRTRPAAEAVARVLEGYPFIESVDYGAEWIGRLDLARRLLGGLGALVGGLLAAVAVALISATIRMGFLSRQEEVQIMTLCGATDLYIARPFLAEGLGKGLLGGALAVGLLYLTTRLVQSNLLPIVFLSVPQIWAGIGLGGILGALGSLWVAARYLRGQ